jgi:S-adenosylmethionine:tRNA ribosyltransferase-isomerase
MSDSLRPARPPVDPDPLAPYDYVLPEQAVAVHPPALRDGGRLLDLTGLAPVDRHVVDLPELLQKGDLVVVNDTRVLHARLRARRKTGGQVELMVLGTGENGVVEVMARPARRLKVGETLHLVDVHGNPVDDLSATLLNRLDGGVFRVALVPGPAEVMARVGEVPLPPYLQRDAVPADRLRYQTIFAGEAGAVAAPTAGLHLTPAIVQRLEQKGVAVVRVTLHVGAGTFRNLRPEDLDRGELHPEQWRIPETTAAAIRRCRARGGRVVAVGTTSTRTLESAARQGLPLQAGEGTTRLFIQPGYRFQVVDLLWTNLHLPRSSLLMLVCAFGGVERVMAAYEHAVNTGYRFFSYGDAMLVSPSEGAADHRVG